jgi:hypothetical protein
MAWTMGQLANPSDLISAKLGTNTVAASGHLTDADIGKPLKLSAADVYTTCADGDHIDGWLVGVSDYTVDGWAFGTVQIGGRVYAQLEGSSTFGYLTIAATTAAARTVEPSGYGQVKSSGVYALTTGNISTTIPFINAKKWKIVSGAVTDDAIVLLEKQ